MRKVSMFLFLVLLVLTTGVFSVAAATLTVDGSCVDTSPADGQCDSSSAYSNIQAAIDAAAPNDTIDVLAGTYVENLNVNKSLTLYGPNAYPLNFDGKRGQGLRVPEAVIQGQVTIAAADVTINGFTITNPGQQFGVSGTVGGGATDGILIQNNIITDVGSVGLTANVKGVSFQGGTDDVVITDNWFDNINANEKSVNAIFFGDSLATDPSEDVVIRNNYFSNIESQTKGGYGILLNLGVNVIGGGVPGVIIERNIFDTITGGGWNHAIGLETTTLDAQVLDNTFFDLTAGSADNTAIFFEGNTDGDTVIVQGNRFLGNGFFGVAIHPDDLPPSPTSYTVDATNNWWNGTDGPSDPGIGNGATGTGTPVANTRI